MVRSNIRGKVNYPQVKTTVDDDDSGVTWHVIAHRVLSQAEIMTKIHNYLEQRNGYPHSGTSVIIIDHQSAVRPARGEHRNLDALD